MHSQTPWLSKFVEPMHVMPTLEGNEFHLNMQSGTKDFFEEFSTETYGFNNEFLGPVLIYNRGEEIKVFVTNNMDEETTLHQHGIHLPAIMDGGPASIIYPGETWLSQYTVKDQAATYWYHPHPHRMTDEQVTNGLAGMIIIRDEEEAALDLPRSYGVDDYPLLIQSKAFNLFNGEINPIGSETHFMVNGTIYPYLEAPAQLVRLRLLNGSNLRVLNVGFSDNRTFHMITSDGGLLPEPVPLNRMSLGTGERAEILVDLSDLTPGGNEHLYMVNYSAEQSPGTPGTLFTNAPSILDSKNIRFMEIRAKEATKYPVEQIPETLRPPYAIWQEEEADVHRRYQFEIDWFEFITSGFLNGFSIDNQPFSHHHINHISYIDDVEIWEIYNNTPFGHPFHIHSEQFYILDRNGEPPPAHEAGRKDVVLVNGFETVRFITSFKDYTDPVNAYMYHCHILSHEDAGMMGQFLVVDRVTGLAENLLLDGSIDFYPNPVSDIGRIRLTDQSLIADPLIWRIVALNGQVVRNNLEMFGQEMEVQAGSLAPGVYVLQALSGGELVGKVLFEKL